MAEWINDPQNRGEVEKVTKELKLPVWQPFYKGKFREFWNESWAKIEDGYTEQDKKIKKVVEDVTNLLNTKEDKITKKSGFNLEKSDDVNTKDSNKLATSKAVADLNDMKVSKNGDTMNGGLTLKYNGLKEIKFLDAGGSNYLGLSTDGYSGDINLSNYISNKILKLYGNGNAEYPANNLQTSNKEVVGAINELNSGKVNKSGGTISGDLTVTGTTTTAESVVNRYLWIKDYYGSQEKRAVWYNHNNDTFQHNSVFFENVHDLFIHRSKVWNSGNLDPSTLGLKSELVFSGMEYNKIRISEIDKYKFLLIVSYSELGSAYSTSLVPVDRAFDNQLFVFGANVTRDNASYIRFKLLFSQKELVVHSRDNYRGIAKVYGIY